MAWTLYAYTKGGTSLYVGSWGGFNAARGYARSSCNRNWTEVPAVDPAIEPWIVPVSEVIQIFYLVEEDDPGPNAAVLDAITGLDLV